MVECICISKTLENQSVWVDRVWVWVWDRSEEESALEENLELCWDGAVDDEVWAGGDHDQQVWEWLQTHDVCARNPSPVRTWKANGNRFQNTKQVPHFVFSGYFVFKVPYIVIIFILLAHNFGRNFSFWVCIINGLSRMEVLWRLDIYLYTATLVAALAPSS